MRDPALVDRAADASAPLDRRWAEMHETAGQVAQLADLSPESASKITARFAQGLAHADSRACELAERGIADIEALLAMGLKALRCVEERGQDPSAPALALWREFYHAREAVLSVLEPIAA